jgi:hypothetical protein
MAIVHKPFKYVPAISTDISKTIKRERDRLKALEQAKRKTEVQSPAKVTPLPTGKPHKRSDRG